MLLLSLLLSISYFIIVGTVAVTSMINVVSVTANTIVTIITILIVRIIVIDISIHYYHYHYNRLFFTVITDLTGIFATSILADVCGSCFSSVCGSLADVLSVLALFIK